MKNPDANNASVSKAGCAGRKRRAAGWTLLILGVLVTGVWIASGWFQWWLKWGDYGVVRIGSGQATAARHVVPQWFMSNWERGLEPIPAGQTGWRLGAWAPTDSLFSTTWNLVVIARADLPGGRSTSWTLVLWPIPLLFYTAAALLLRSGILARRRAMTNTCTKCGYPLTGLAQDAACPECGKHANATSA